jgi:hypothetical protein
MDTTFLQERITATKAQIVAYEDASLAFGTSNIQSYTLDTGQSRQTVTRADLSQLQRTLEGLYNRLVVLEARLTGNGVLIGTPAW